MARPTIVRHLVASLLGVSLLAGCGTLSDVSGTRSSLAQGQSEARVMSLIQMPEAGHQPLLQAIKAAKKSILVQMYILTYSGGAMEITDALVAQSKAGLDVRVIIENQPYIPRPKLEPGEIPPPMINPNKAALQVLIAGGVRVKRSSPQFNYTHQKSMVIDGSAAYVMTTNFSAAAFVKNREYVIVDRSPSDVAEVTRLFEADWAEKPFVAKDPDMVISPVNSRAQILKLIDSAKKTLTIQVEFATDPEVIAHIAQAQARGVKVTVQLSYIRPDPKLDEDINAKEKQLFNDAGITALKFVKHVGLHCKLVVADSARAYVGSENFSSNSLDKNRELGVILDQPDVVKQLEATAKADWEKAPIADEASVLIDFSH